MALSQDEILILTRLLGAPEFVAAADAEAAALGELGVASEATGRSFEHSRRRGFLMNQALFTMRRLTYGATLAFVGLSIASLKWGFDFNSAMQQARVALSPVIRGSGALTKELDYLFNFTKYTPFQFKDVTIAFRQMYLGFRPLGISVDMTNQTIKALVDNLAATGKTTPGNLNRVSVALTHMANIGRLTGQGALQLARDGIQIYPALRKELGLTADQMHNIGQLGIPMQTVLSAIIKYTESTPGLMNAAHRQAIHTFHGLFTTFRDNMSQILGAVEMGFFRRTQNRLNDLNNWFNRFAKTIRSGNVHDILRAIGGPYAVLVWNLLGSALHYFWVIFSTIIGSIARSRMIWGFLIAGLFVLTNLLRLLAWNSNILAGAIKILIPLFILWVTWQKAMILWTGIMKLTEAATTKATKDLTFAQFLFAVMSGRYTLAMKIQTAAMWLYNTALWATSTATDWLMMQLALMNILLETTPVGWILTIVALAAGVLILYFRWRAFHNAVNNTIMWLYRHPLVAFFVPVVGQILLAVRAARALWHVLQAIYRTASHPLRLLSGGHGFSFGNLARGLARSLLPPIPGLAAGGTTMSSGSVLVGEYGPELLHLPAAATVTPLSTRSSAGGQVQPIVIQLLMNKKVLAEAYTDVQLSTDARL